MHQNNLASLWLNFGDFWEFYIEFFILHLTFILGLNGRVRVEVKDLVRFRVRDRVKDKVRGFWIGVELVSERGFQKVVNMHPNNR